MDISRVLGHLQDIHDAPDDGRDFVAFEKRPEMLAAGVPAEAFDRFDFRKRLAVAREMDALSGGGPVRPPEPRAPMQRPIMESNPKGFISTEDRLAAGQKGGDPEHYALASGFIKNNMIHSMANDGYNVISPPTTALTDALYEFARTPPGRDVMQRARDHGSKQTYVYNPALEEPAYVHREDRSAIQYNSQLPPWNGATVKSQIAGDELDTSTPMTVLAHEIGHTALGRQTYGLEDLVEPPIPIGPKNEVTVWNGPTRLRREEEIRAIRRFENPSRAAVRAPPRRSYYDQGDVTGPGASK